MSSLESRGWQHDLFPPLSGGNWWVRFSFGREQHTWKVPVIAAQPRGRVLTKITSDVNMEHLFPLTTVGTCELRLATTRLRTLDPSETSSSRVASRSKGRMPGAGGGRKTIYTPRCEHGLIVRRTICKGVPSPRAVASTVALA